MERPMRLGFSAKDARGRVASAATTIAIEFGAVFGLIAALNQGALIRELQVIQATVEAPREAPKQPPPPLPDMARPAPPVAIVPQFAVQNPAPSPITTVPKPSVAPPPVPHVPLQPSPSSDPLRPIMRTHAVPPYPPIARRLNEQGTTLMVVTISVQGNVSECNVAESSGSERLDQAACDFVKQNWRWQPPTKAGEPVSTKTRVSVKWTLQNAS